jgi:hypothetical protein
MDRVRRARGDMLEQYSMFMNNESWRNEVISATSENSGISEPRISEYFRLGVENRLDTVAVKGLEKFLREACGLRSDIEWVILD